MRWFEGWAPRRQSWLLIVGCTVMLWGNLSVAAEADLQPFSHSEDVQSELDILLHNARLNQKQALVVLGANWCHDSISLAEKFANPAVKGVLSEHYEVLFVDVGYLNDRRNVTQRFEYPNYFATPTVFVVEPHSGKLVNRQTIHKWANAERVTLEEYQNYFAEHADLEARNIPALAAPVLAKLNAFAEAQSARLQAGYERLGPLLQAYEQGQKDGPFYDVWNEVKAFRFRLQSDLTALREHVIANADSVNFEQLTLPGYGPFSWESP